MKEIVMVDNETEFHFDYPRRANRDRQPRRAGGTQVKELLFSVTMADCEMQTFTVGGNGGSGKDTSNTGVRIIHRPSGAVGEAREERSQLANKQHAFKRMARSAEMQRWLKLEAAKRAGQPSIDELVKREMAPGKLKVEVKNEQGRWTDE